MARQSARAGKGDALVSQAVARHGKCRGSPWISELRTQHQLRSSSRNWWVTRCAPSIDPFERV